MAFSKKEIQAELLEFMQGYASNVERLYGGNIAEQLAEERLITKSNLWNAVNEMYDYGVLGTPITGFGVGEMIDGIHADAEVFLNCISRGAMDLYFDEDDVKSPKLSIKAMATAVARHVLEGGERYTDYGAGDYGLGNGDWGYLTLSEMALLADMDERSVRNAANPKFSDPLKTETVGKRALVNLIEAKRWLAGRKVFIPTRINEDLKKQVTSSTIKLPSNLAEMLETKAQQAGLSVADFIEKII